ncbi:antibiotic biosynthesis monooxygenase [Accumulibacter sp.]|uniref:antibiotic biosynthesis monooxygenase n=1 Tax=Accumulibacter sp. TaxID=2053492 RepID=UPI0026218E61|nr:antibiotic biosynthesis monooxygenase [Accumulibacter sp.]
MHVTLVHVRVRPEHLDAFIAATRANHEASVSEAGNRRFDVLQAPDDPTRFILYEAYASAADAAAHKETAHYLAWRTAVAEMMAEPRRGEPMNGLFPA